MENPNWFKTSNIRTVLCEIAKETTVHRLGTWDGTPGIILRQDVDLDLVPARAFADLQMECGVRSTFCVLTTSPTYNCLTLENQTILKSLVQDGFEVALHLDASFGLESLQERAVAEAAVLEHACGAPITSLSLHAPSVTGQYPVINGFRNAYSAEIFSPECYLSDSRMNFRRSPRDVIEDSKKSVVQLLLHPLHYTKEGRGYDYIFAGYLKRFLLQADSYFRSANHLFAQQIPVGLEAFINEGGLANTSWNDES